MPARKSMKSSTKGRKAYPKRKSVRSTVMQRASTLQYAADPVPPAFPLSTSVKEQKFLDATLLENLDCEASPDHLNIQHLNQISQGTTVNQRIGMRYAMTGLHIRGKLHFRGPAQIFPALAGYWIVYDSEPHGVKATAQEMFNLKFDNMQFAFPNGSEGQKGGRFQYLYRKVRQLGNLNDGSRSQSGDGSVPSMQIVDDYIPLKKLEVQHKRLDTFGGISHISKGALLIVPFGYKHDAAGDVVATTEYPQMNFTYRLYFTE